MAKGGGALVPMVLSYLQLRKAVGIIGFSLPVVLALAGSMLNGHFKIECSMSDYYHTSLVSVFVGSLCAIGVFLISTRGYDKKDEAAGYLAGIFAIGVALFRTSRCKEHADLVAVVHFTSAALLFLTLAYFCLKLFIKTTYAEPTPQKLKRNIVYRICGVLILISIAAIAVVKLTVSTDVQERYAIVFWLEALAVMAFGFAWLVKGETFFKDHHS
jgi:glucose-6-phosphate-specific signal transduction histidine kinase